MNKLSRKIFDTALFPATKIIRFIQNDLGWIKPYQVILLVSKISRLVRSINGSSKAVQFPDTVYSSENESGTMKIGFIGHSFHQKTVSSQFFIRFLRQHGSVTVMWDSQWDGGIFPTVEEINSRQFGMLIIWQVMIFHKPEKLKKLNCRNIVIIPMFDDIHLVPDSVFLKYREFRFVAFCRELQHRFDRLGLPSKYFQYYKDPASLPVQRESFTELRGFFWQRTSEITWEHIRKLIEGTRFASFHLHLAIDAIWFHDIRPSEEDMEKYRITITRWFDKQEDYWEVVRKANVFFTPRIFEGIGMSGIEAMAMGKVVVAPDQPTMNEYIRHGYNGLLYDINDPRPLCFSDAGRISENAKLEAQKGFERWNSDGTALWKYLSNNEI